MNDYTKEFMPFDGHVWLNAASEGPLPIAAAEALKEAVVWKSLPYQLTLQKFTAVPKELKQSLAKFLNVPYRDIILGNSASYGLHLLANGISWQSGDEIIVMQNDFPSDILPWLHLQTRGVIVKQLPAKDKVLSPDELQAAFSGKTRLFCISHVHTFTGIMIDIEAFAKICRVHDVIFVLNLSQTLGNMPVDLNKWDVDCVVGAGYKWLVGPYGTGYMWLKPELRGALDVNHAYWPAVLSDEELKSEGPLSVKQLNSARQLDVFGTANFFNFVPWRHALELLAKIGIEKIQAHNQDLIDRFLEGLGRDKYDVVSEEKREARSNLVVISHKDSAQNPAVFKMLTAAGVYPALWKNRLRFAPHLYNTPEEIQRTVVILNNV